ncbi:MAG TPA: response regulator, partial [Candidatus Polarisedimenticolaceae bacterium]|nr:response regulator [Candidatus Polarisedimenticolaceae bacterium]
QGADKGSEFIVRLPLEDKLRTEMERDNLRHSGQLSSKRVLVVDDNRDAADSLGKLLNLAGAEARAVYNGFAALEVLPTYRPAVLLVDIGMPDMDGYELARRVRQLPECGDLTLIALTGWGQAEDRQRSQAAGFDFHLTKPADFNVLQTLLDSVQDRQRSHTRH